MKKLSLVLAIMVFLIANVDAQKSKRTSALNYLKKGKLDKAKEYIDIAAKHPKTGIDAKTWLYRGNIYVSILTDSTGKYDELKKDAVDEAIKSYQNVLKYDKKGLHSIEANNKILALTDFVFNDAANILKQAYNETDEAKRTDKFNQSASLLDKAYKLYKSAGRTDTTVLYYSALANEQANNTDKAIELYSSLIEMKYNKPDIYIALGNIYSKQNKSEEAIKIFNQGSERYPKNLNIVLNASNVYLKGDDPMKAINILEKAAEMDPSNPSVHSAIGTKYDAMLSDSTLSDAERQSFRNKAIASFSKAIELKPDFFDPNFNMGVMYVNHAVEVKTKADALPFEKQKEYDALNAEADQLLAKALPYMEKSHSIDPSDKDVMNSLKEIYARLKKYDKLKEIQAELNKK